MRTWYPSRNAGFRIVALEKTHCQNQWTCFGLVHRATPLRAMNGLADGSCWMRSGSFLNLFDFF